MFVFVNEKKIHKDLADIWHWKMALKIRILQYLIINTKSNLICTYNILMAIFIDFWLDYLLLNSATISCLIKVTLKCLYVM